VPWFFLAIALSLLLRIPYLRVGMISDEGGYAYVAQRWLEGRGTLYDDIWVSRPQGIFVVYAAIMRTIGSSVIDLRIGAWLFVVATMPAVYAVARYYAGRRAAIVALLLFAVISSSPLIEGFTANAEVFTALPCAVIAWLLLRTQKCGWRWHHLVIIGALGSIATLLKPSGFVMIPMAMLFCWLAGEGGVRMALKRSAWMIAGVLVGVAPALIHGWMVGWDNFVFASFTYRLEYQSTVTASWGNQLNAALGMVQRLIPLLIVALFALGVRQWRHASPPRVLAISGGSQLADAAVSPLTRIRLYARRHPASLLLWLWVLASIAGISLGGDWWYHYAIQIVAPLCILLAPLLLNAGEHLRGLWRWTFVFAVSAVLLFPSALMARVHANATTIAVYPNQGYERQQDVAEYLQTHGTPGAPMLVAFDQAALYYLSDRPAAFRYMYAQEMAAIPNTEQMMVAVVLGDDRPEFVIDTGEPAPFHDGGASFWAAVQQNYQMVSIINGFKIYQVNE
jgi:4-amino-4-deoxy-L-arabinose transferase-like glycosyltransferase